MWKSAVACISELPASTCVTSLTDWLFPALVFSYLFFIQRDILDMGPDTAKTYACCLTLCVVSSDTRALTGCKVECVWKSLQDQGRDYVFARAQVTRNYFLFHCSLHISGYCMCGLTSIPICVRRSQAPQKGCKIYLGKKNKDVVVKQLLDSLS